MVHSNSGLAGVVPVPAVISGSSTAAGLRARSRTEIPVTGSPLEDEEVKSWRGDIPGEVQQLGPQVVAEATTNKQLTVFSHVSTSVARELSAAAPSLTTLTLEQAFPNPQPSAGTGAPPRPAGHVQFSHPLDFAPGEVNGTPRGAAMRGVAMGVAFAESLGRSFGGLSGFSTFQAPPSPERAPRFQASSTMKLHQSGTGRAMLQTSVRPGPLCHLENLERPQDVAALQLQITLQHSHNIEKVSAADLTLFAVGETPYVNGSEVSPGVIRDIRGAPELRRGAFYVPSDVTDAAASGNREVVSGMLTRSPRGRPVVVQLFVLFPSLMRPPQWLRRDFTMVKKAVVEADWQLSRSTQFLLYCLRRLELARSQSLVVWASKRRFGAGETFTLYGAEGRTEMTDRSYVLLLKFYERHEGPGPKSAFNLSREGPLLQRQPGSTVGPAGEIGTTPSLVGPGGGGYGGGGGGLDAPSFGGFGTGSCAPGTYGFRGSTRMDPLQEQLQLLRAQSSDASGQIPIPEAGLTTWDGLLDYTLAARDGAALRRLISSHYLDHLLKSQGAVDRVEKVAIANNDPALMMLLYEHTVIEMDLRVLAFLVHCWAVQPLSGRAAAALGGGGGGRMISTQFYDAAGANDELPEFFDGADEGGNLGGKIEEFLVKYVLQRRNPLSVTAAILRAIEDEIAQHEENRRLMRLAVARFHSLHLSMLRRLNMYADVRNIRFVERIVMPAEMPNSVNEVSPMQVAFDSCDLKFMTAALIELYVKVQWMGRELLALTAHEDPRALGATNPLLAYAVLKSAGFAGKGTMDPLVMAASRLWHIYVFTSNAFFNSPRGRWTMHALFELVFLGLYQWQVMYPKMDLAQLRTVHLVFMTFILGNLLDMVQFVHFRYGSVARIRKYLADPWNTLSLVVNGCLLALTGLKLAQDFGAAGISPYQSADTIHMCMATLAVFVWVRALGMAVPVYPSLGPLLNTVARMMEEVIAFLFPMLIVMTGFSTMMAAIYQDLVPDYGNFVSAMLQLFSSMLGDFDFTLFDGLPMAQQLYGIIVQVIFLVISAILLMNLLIAIITNRYRPQEVEAESQFKKAQIVVFYNTQVARNLVCSPFCLPQLLLQSFPLLPSGRRTKLSGSARGVSALGLVPLDGVVLPDDGSDRPTGAAEMPHLMFLLTLYPIMAVTCILMFVLYTPFGVIQFAGKTCTRSLKRYGKRVEQRRRRDQRTGKKENRHKTPPGAKQPGWEEQQQQPSDAATTTTTTTAAGDVESGGGDTPAVRNSPSASTSTPTDASKQYQRLKKELQAEAHQAEVGLLHTAGYLLASTILTVVGLLFYVAVLLLLMLLGWSSLYQWLAKLAFSLYNILLRPFADMMKSRRRQQRISKAAAAAARVASGGGGGDAASASAAPGGGGGGGESSNLAHQASKARLHWRHAIQRVIAMKNARYLTKRDVLKCLAASKFKPHMEAWQLRADLRSSSQDILNSQLLDMEDDTDPWDDNELQGAGDEDDDTLETAILDKTEQLTSMLKGGIAAQQAAMAALTDRVRELTEEVARMRDTAGGGNSADGDQGADGGAAAVTASPPATEARPGPPPTRPPSVWGLMADPPRGECECEGEGEGSNEDAVLMASGVRREPELAGEEGAQPTRRLSLSITSSAGTERRPQAQADDACDASGARTVAEVEAATLPRSPADATPARPGRARAKTALPRPPPAVSSPSPTNESLPPPSLAFAATAGPAAGPPTTTTSPPQPPPPPAARPPLAPGSRAVAATTPSTASRASGGSPVAPTHGSARRSSSAGAEPRALQQQMTVDRLLDASGGGADDAMLAAIGTEREGTTNGGRPTATNASASRPILKPIQQVSVGGLGPAVAGSPGAAAPPLAEQ